MELECAGNMFLRCTTRWKDGKEHRYWSMVENRRTRGRRIVQQTVLYLGEINDSQKEQWIRAIDPRKLSKSHASSESRVSPGSSECNERTPGVSTHIGTIHPSRRSRISSAGGEGSGQEAGTDGTTLCGSNPGCSLVSLARPGANPTFATGGQKEVWLSVSVEFRCSGLHYTAFGAGDSKWC